MKIYLLRHGTAEDEPRAGGDFARELVEKGRRQCRAVGTLLRRMGATRVVILASPLVRARQTAVEVARVLGLHARAVREEPRLAPGASTAAAVQALLEADADGAAVLAVGHEPSLSQLAARLVGAPGLALDLRKAGLVEIELLSRNPLRGALLGLVRPGHLE